MSKTIIVGITGGICTGKSAVLNFIKEKGYITLSSDARAAELMVTNYELKSKLINAFGEEVYIEEKINKPYLSELVFSDTAEAENNLNKLNSIVHPYVIQDLIEQVDEYTQQGVKFVFNESALIYEAGLEDGYDYIIVVDSNYQIRLQRATEKGLTQVQFDKRIDAQISQEEKRGAADFVISNNGTLVELKSAVDMIISILEVTFD